MPRLDGLRGLAILGVLVEHFCPSPMLRSLSTGGIAVTLFFVLSGYLITRILLDYKRQGVATRAAAIQFYWRRFLRLAPPLYLAIFVFGVLGNALHHNAGWHALYLTNVLIAVSGQWGTGADHFWSLATEEQFYLLWFFVVMLLPHRLLVVAISISFVVTLCFRAFVYFSGLSLLTNVLLPGNLASLTAGALVAVATTHHVEWLLTALRSRLMLLVSAVLSVALTLSLNRLQWPNALFYPFIVSAFSSCVVLRATRNDERSSLRWLAWAPLRHVGRISYGIYVYHLFVPGPIFDHLHLPFDRDSWIGFVFSVAASILVAEASWRLVEQPAMRLKSRWFGWNWLTSQR